MPLFFKKINVEKRVYLKKWECLFIQWRWKIYKVETSKNLQEDQSVQYPVNFGKIKNKNNQILPSILLSNPNSFISKLSLCS